jgi:hypothetical protein
MKHLLLSVGCIAMLSACSGGLGSLGGGSSAGGSSAGGSSANGSFANRSSSVGSRQSNQNQDIPAKAVDNRAYLPVLKSARMDTAKGGKILRVQGEIDRVGYYDLELVLVEDDTSNTITYQARAAAPAIGRAALTPRQRRVTVGVFVPTSFRPSARTIVVQGLQNTIRITR